MMKGWTIGLCILPVLIAAFSFAAPSSELSFGALEPAVNPTSLIQLALPDEGPCLISLAAPLIRRGGESPACPIGIKLNGEWRPLPLWPTALTAEGARTIPLRVLISLADRAGDYAGHIRIQSAAEVRLLPCTLRILPRLELASPDRLTLVIPAGETAVNPAMAAPARLRLAANVPWRLLLTELAWSHEERPIQPSLAGVSLTIDGPDGVARGPLPCARLLQEPLVLAEGEPTGGRTLEFRLRAWWQPAGGDPSGLYRGWLTLDLCSREESSGPPP